MLKRLLIFVITLILFSNSVFADPNADGFEALNEGDYKSAIKHFKRAAEQGNSNSYVYLGIMYAKGEGMLPDYMSAIKYYKLAAEQGDAYAMLLLGVIYENGDGVTQDDELALMWFNLASALGDKDAASKRDKIAKKMSSSQIENSQKLANQCLKSNYKDCM